MNFQGIEISLRNVKTFEGHDTKTGLNADIVYKGYMIAHIHDDARGGCFDYHVLGELKKTEDGYEDSPDRARNKKLFAELEEKLAALPEYEPEGWGFKIQPDLDHLVDKAFNEWEDAQIIKKNQKKGILTRVPNGISTWGWKTTIPTMMKKYGKHIIIADLNKQVKAFKEEGKEILNIEYLKSIGVEI